MPFDRQRVRRCLKAFDFETLFIDELGWDHLDIRPQVVTIDGQAFRLAPVAHKRGVQIFTCDPDADGRIPEYKTRQKIDRQVTKRAREHLVIFVDDEKTTQIWQWVDRRQGKPTAYREHTFHTRQSGEALIQKLRTITFTLDEEEALTLSDVPFRLKDAFDKETVTKRFYQTFSKEHAAFLKVLKGIALEKDREWYTSVMLNRLMFVYFIQKKGFLDGDVDYLRNRLRRLQKQFGGDRFYSFYRHFLIRLFHQGLGSPERNPELEALLGDIPFLNGGIFQPHELEEQYDEIDLPDKAFERLFDFFDQYQWHLDYRPLQNDREINPDVLGYIFEQYINQKQMGAYYTKEDITGYISRNTILPFLFDKARKGCQEAFEGTASVWTYLQDDPDRYIYPAVKQGIYDDHSRRRDLPDAIAAGLNDVSKRGVWNTLAPAEYALPTEIWREVVARRQRYDEVRGKLASGQVQDIDDLITLNLDIEQFAQDVIERCEGPYLLRAFFKAIRTVTVLDPTCGSGAFLFAALGILQPLYEACLTRMQAFVEDLERSGEKHHPATFKDFREILAEAYDEAKHPNLDYYILKSIILNNLYGVDIMAEAVEICKLRLFLKLAAQIERKEDLEPLPDIDFNIRAGNTLVGYATYDEVQHAMTASDKVGTATQAGQRKILFEDDQAAIQRFMQRAEDVAVLEELFREQQTLYGGIVRPEDKKDLRERLRALEDELNRYLASEYGVKKADEQAYATWLASHQPFHWFVEFHGIMSQGGFSVIIGNPPYVRYNPESNDYKVLGYYTLDCKDLYAFLTERSLLISWKAGKIGLIVPISIFNTDGFKTLQDITLRELQTLWVSHYSNRPSQLFSGAQKRLTILLGKKEKAAEKVIFSTRYFRWNSDEREHLFETRPSYFPAVHPFSVFKASLEKLGSALEFSAFEKLVASQDSLAMASCDSSPYKVYYTRSFQYFLAFLNFIPEMTDIETGERKLPSELKEIDFRSADSALSALASLSSSTFFWFWHVLSDCRNLNKRDVLAFRINPEKLDDQIRLSLQDYAQGYLRGLKASSSTMLKSGMHIQTFDYSSNKPIIDQIDRDLAGHYGFTDEELDFIINYDIKYRMGVDTFEAVSFEEAGA